MNSMALEDQHRSGVYGKRQLVITRGLGASVWDEQGRQYIDCVAGIGVANIGHCHPRLVEAVGGQSRTLLACPELFYNDRRAAFLERLSKVLPGDLARLYLCNSGAEAVEAALKFARLSTGRPGIIAAARGFHGRTLGALSATYERKYRAPFSPLVPGFRHVPFDDAAALDEAFDDQTAALILEVIQGEGGVRPGSEAYFKAARRLCDEHDALLILDEVQTGFGRTGRWFACEDVAVTPDLLCLGKAIGGGLPMGAVAIGSRVKGLGPGVHGSTFGGNPLACAAALASLEVIEEENLVAQAAGRGSIFLEMLRSLSSPLIRDVRGRGLMIGVELKTRAHYVVKALMARGILALTAGTTVLRLLPPLVISEAEVRTVVTALQEALTEVEAAQLGRGAARSRRSVTLRGEE